MDSVYVYAVTLSISLSLVQGYIEVSYSSGEKGKSMLCLDFFTYLLILSIGNSVSTLLAPSILESTDLGELTELKWVVYAVMGVFGFSAVLKNTDIKLFDRSFVSFSEWLKKAKDNASAAAIERSTRLEYENACSIASKLREVSEVDLNTHVVSALEPEVIKEIESMTQGKDVDTHFLKALSLAEKDPSLAGAIAERQSA